MNQKHTALIARLEADGRLALALAEHWSRRDLAVQSAYLAQASAISEQIEAEDLSREPLPPLPPPLASGEHAWSVDPSGWDPGEIAGAKKALRVKLASGECRRCSICGCAGNTAYPYKFLPAGSVEFTARKPVCSPPRTKVPGT